MKYYKGLIGLIVIYICFILINEAYFKFYPTIPIYPNSRDEIKIVKNLMKNRTKKDIDLFHKTNITTTKAFLPFVDESEIDLRKIEIDLRNIEISFHYKLLAYKYLINRIRPWQLDREIIPIDKYTTAMTPAYPAGHAYCAYFIAKHLTKLYPHKKELFYRIALDCDLCRIKAGLHYPSDGQFARELVDRGL